MVYPDGDRFAIDLPDNHQVGRQTDCLRPDIPLTVSQGMAVVHFAAFAHVFHRYPIHKGNGEMG